MGQGYPSCPHASMAPSLIIAWNRLKSVTGTVTNNVISARVGDKLIFRKRQTYLQSATTVFVVLTLSADIVAENDVDAVMSKTATDIEGCIEIQGLGLESSLQWGQRSPRAILIQVLGKLTAVAMDIKQAGDAGEDMRIWIAICHL